MPEKIKKLAFWELDSGRLGLKMQSEFEQAQITARDRGVPVKVNLQIVCMPPDVEDPRFGGIVYKISSKEPNKESKVITTELQDGIIINEGEDVGSILQTSLEFSDALKFKKDGTNDGK